LARRLRRLRVGRDYDVRPDRHQLGRQLLVAFLDSLARAKVKHDVAPFIPAALSQGLDEGPPER
jgi:hypothetical protein